MVDFDEFAKALVGRRVHVRIEDNKITSMRLLPKEGEMEDETTGTAVTSRHEGSLRAAHTFFDGDKTVVIIEQPGTTPLRLTLQSAAECSRCGGDPYVQPCTVCLSGVAPETKEQFLAKWQKRIDGEEFREEFEHDLNMLIGCILHKLLQEQDAARTK